MSNSLRVKVVYFLLEQGQESFFIERSVSSSALLQSVESIGSEGHWIVLGLNIHDLDLSDEQGEVLF